MSEALTMTVIESVDALSAGVGREVACSDWLTIDHRVESITIEVMGSDVVDRVASKTKVCV